MDADGADIAQRRLPEVFQFLELTKMEAAASVARSAGAPLADLLAPGVRYVQTLLNLSFILYYIAWHAVAEVGVRQADRYPTAHLGASWLASP